MLFAAACRHKFVDVVPLPPPVGPPEHEVLYRDGLNAFRQATPEGYERAAEAFRKASRLNASNCEYSLHLVEALLFLAQEQRLNSEDFAPRLTEAGAILNVAQTTTACSAFESTANRLSGMHLYLREPLRRNEAVTAVNKAIELDPNDPLNWVVLSKLTSRDPRNPVQRALDLAPDLPLVQYEYGNYLLYVAGGFPKAQQAFDRAIELSPRHFESIVGKVYSLSIDEYSEESEPLLKQVIEIAPSFLTGRRLMGDYYAGMEEIEKAVEQYRAAIGFNTNYYPAFLALGRTLMGAERLDEAEAALLSLIKLDVTTPRPPLNGTDYAADCQAHYLLGNIWFERGDLAKAYAEYQRALADIPTYPDALYSMGLVLSREGKADEALVKFNQVIKDNPDNYAGAYIARAGIRFNRRQFSDAIADYTRSIGIFQEQIAALDTKANLDESKGRQRKADTARKRKATLEAELGRAVESRKTTEAELAN